MPATVTRRFDGSYTAVTRTRRHLIVGDEPPEFGGEGLGPTPVELLQAAVAHCTVVTMVGEAELRGFALPPVEVRVTYTVNHTADGPADPAQRELELTGMRKHVRVEGALTGDQQDAIRHAVASCPVSRTLAKGIRVRDVVSFGDAAKEHGSSSVAPNRQEVS
jgi:uncharacterized OsmC-like protein